MRYEPPVDRPRLLAAVRQHYALNVTSIRFEPLGLGSACYVLEAAGEGVWFLKLWPHLRMGLPEAETQHARLALSLALHERVPELRVPYPLATRDGALWAAFDAMPLAIFPLLAGEHPTSPWPPALSVTLGGTVAALHRSTPLLTDVIPGRDGLGIPYEAALRDGLAAAARLGQGERPGLLALRAWVLAHGDEVRGQLGRLHILQRDAQRTACPEVLCHMDLHRENLLIDRAGRLSLLDWDDARLAPPEHDLWYPLLTDTAAESFPALIEAYLVAGGAPLHTACFAFYLLRRYLEDLSVNLSDLLTPGADEREDAAHLHAMEAWSAVYWRRLDITLELVDTALRMPGASSR